MKSAEVCFVRKRLASDLQAHRSTDNCLASCLYNNGVVQAVTFACVIYTDELALSWLLIIPLCLFYFQIHSVSLTILVSIHLLIHFSTHLCHHPHSRHPSLLHSFTPGSNLPFQQILPTLDFFYLLDCLTITGLDRTYRAHYFISSFTL